MSLVGPRPALPDEVDQQAPDAALRRHRLKPGITGYWQVSGRSEVAADEALRMDLYYVENWSLAFDLLILIRTTRAVLTRDGAY
jgi:lipopolysaccharide/colanic/teichoic acid biosynthesis glycosyltransferase